jgi:hypothetical protein
VPSVTSYLAAARCGYPAVACALFSLHFASTVSSEKTGTTLRTAVADYYSLVAKAVGALNPNTAEARRKVYDRARAALLSELQKSVPAWDRSEIMAEQLFLELAIGEVEAEVQPLQCDPRRLDEVTLAPADDTSIKPKLPANCNARDDRGSVAPARSRDVDPSGGEAAVRDQRPNSPMLEESDVEPVRDTWLTDFLRARQFTTTKIFRTLRPNGAQAA